MNSTNLIAYLPVVMPPSWEEEFEVVIHEILDELCSLSGALEFSPGALEFSSRSDRTFRPAIEVLDFDEDQTGLEEWVEFRGRKKALIKISTEVSVSDKTIEALSPSGEVVYWEGERAEESDKLSIRSIFEKGLYDIAIVANIARPGSLEFGRGVLFQDGEYKRMTDEMGQVYLLRGAVQLADSIEWPRLQTLNFAQVWRWAIEQEGFVEGFGGGPIGRALNAFANLFQPRTHDEVANLLWALVGIEALYTSGQGALQEQVKEKSQTLLGKQTAHKKKIGQMYSFRSRFIHGDLDISGKYPLHDARDEFEAYHNDLFESVCLAEAILLASLQKLVELNWKGLTFSYQVKGLPE